MNTLKEIYHKMNLYQYFRKLPRLWRIVTVLATIISLATGIVALYEFFYLKSVESLPKDKSLGVVDFQPEFAESNTNDRSAQLNEISKKLEHIFSSIESDPHDPYNHVVMLDFICESAHCFFDEELIQRRANSLKEQLGNDRAPLEIYLGNGMEIFTPFVEHQIFEMNFMSRINELILDADNW